MTDIRIEVEHVPDADADTSYLDDDNWRLHEDKAAAARRRKEYEDGAFGYIGIRATATVEQPDSILTLMSPGLWGIEDDSGADYFREVAQEEVNFLARELALYGYARASIVAACTDAGYDPPTWTTRRNT